jgi:hypothetical protein
MQNEESKPMTDKEMLYFVYGAVKAVSVKITNLAPIAKILEEHLHGKSNK